MMADFKDSSPLEGGGGGVQGSGCVKGPRDPVQSAGASYMYQKFIKTDQYLFSPSSSLYLTVVASSPASTRVVIFMEIIYTMQLAPYRSTIIPIDKKSFDFIAFCSKKGCLKRYHIF